MTSDRKPVLTGGCQCGAVRYAFYALPSAADICHCRMCQKALGNLFMAVASTPLETFAWTAGEPRSWRSSSVAERGFCGDCGTPLSFQYVGSQKISVTTGSLDDPSLAKPTAQLGIESRVPWFHELAALPATATADDPPPGGPRRADQLSGCEAQSLILARASFASSGRPWAPGRLTLEPLMRTHKQL